MGLPEWWDERRLGLLIRTSVASVPAWAPIGSSADEYRRHLGGDVERQPDHDGHEPLVEVLAHHRDRWGHIERFDDFVPLLRFDAFDAESWARLAVDAGARYAAVVARDGDEWAWWDSPTTPRSMVTNGPHRNVVADFAAACERNDLPLGVTYTACGSDRPGEERDRLAIHDLADLTTRFGVEFVRVGDLDDARGPTCRALAAALPDLSVDAATTGALDELDRGAVRVYRDVPPPEVERAPWELQRDLGPGRGHNRSERREHLLDAASIVALLTEVIAKGGHLLLGVGATADGLVPDEPATALRGAGDWVRAHRDLVDRGGPWRIWGDSTSRFLEVDGVLHVVDLDGRGHFAELTPRVGTITSVEHDGTDIPFHQDDTGLHLDARTIAPAVMRRGSTRAEIDVYRVTVADPQREVGLFDDAPDSPRPPIEIAPLLRDVVAGHIVQLGDGRYTGPATIPAGVTIRGLGPTRTSIDAAEGIRLDEGARLEHLRVGAATRADVAVSIVGDAALVLGCRVDGVVSIHADGASLRATRAGSVRSSGVDRVTITRCVVDDVHGECGIQLRAGTGHHVASCEVTGHRTAIRCSETTGVVIDGNDLGARRCGVHLERAEGTRVHGNVVTATMRGFDVEGGAHATIHGNAVRDGDSGCIVEWGATDCTITGNTWERCRIGVLAWESASVAAHGNEAIDLHDPAAAFTSGPT